MLPPFIPSRPVSQDRSPYRVTLSDLIEHFGTTPARRKILAGFLGFRAALHDMGFVDGFQWLMVALPNGLSSHGFAGPLGIWTL